MGQIYSRRSKWTQESGTRLSVQLVLVLLSVLVLTWLWNIVESHPKGWTDGSIETWIPRTAWIVVLLSLLLLFMVAEILLFGPVQQVIGRQILKRSDPLLTLGCPSCGTVFDWQAQDALEGKFLCPHCNRAGHVPTAQPKPARVDGMDCHECSMEYRVYHRISECPRCHAENIHEQLAT
jgi:predicted Zn-ribbon and HTH transcriptional regulator